ncbi:MAG: hypothetical protein LBR65_04745 [Culturomica sp.]|jgi:hypothetical protein|nr:hypothetical protein [Culturomica sp.]
MRKLIYVGICALALVLFANCKSNKKASPGVVARTQTENLAKGNYDVFVEGIVFEEPVPGTMHTTVSKPVTPEQKVHHVAAVKKHIEPVVKAKGGVKKVAVATEKVAPDGKNAQVSVKTTYNNGDVEHMDYDLVKVNDDWKLRSGHERDVMRRRTAEGNLEVLKLKESPHKEVLKAHEEGIRDFIKEKETEHKEVLKTKVDGEKEVVKDKEKKHEEVIKIKEDGHKEVIRIPKDETKK